MPTLNPEHLLDQATRLATPPAVGRPRQVDLRRAISSAYYAVFHALITAAADEVVGAAQRSSREHALVMRAVDHRTIKNSCEEITKVTPSRPYAAYVPAGGFSPAILAVANLFPDLQNERHAADYDSLRSYATADAASLIATARSALGQFGIAPAADRKAFLYLLLFPPKR